MPWVKKAIIDPPLFLLDGPDDSLLLPWNYCGYRVYSRVKDLRELPEPRWKWVPEKEARKRHEL
jgi:hypothetical protein